jgi:hypothetical protein
MRKSASSATWNADPAATPFSAAMNGFDRLRIEFHRLGQILPGAERVAGAGQDHRPDL